MAGSQAVIEIRQLFHLADFEEVLHLQQAIWGYPDIELLPLRFLVVVNSVGGHVFGAYDGDIMVGFCFAIPGVKSSGQPYLHSHMLGVLPAYRDAHVGRSLKLKQREEALARGIQLIEWTFDPMELKNAFFNIERLGAIVRRYHENQYGITFSPLHGGLPTDRCYAEWWIASPRVEALVGRTPTSAPDPLVPPSEAETPFEAPVGRTAASAPAPEAITYPADIARIRTEDPRRARQIQKENGEKFRHAFEQGLAVTHFERNEHESSYLLEPWK